MHKRNRTGSGYGSQDGTWRGQINSLHDRASAFSGTASARYQSAPLESLSSKRYYSYN